MNFPGTTAELVEADGVGMATTPGDAQDLAQKIKYYADNPEERRRVGEAAKKVAWQKYDRKIIATQLNDVFNECLKK